MLFVTITFFFFFWTLEKYYAVSKFEIIELKFILSFISAF